MRTLLPQRGWGQLSTVGVISSNRPEFSKPAETLEDLQFRFQSKPGLSLSTSNLESLVRFGTRDSYDVYSELDANMENLVVAVQNRRGSIEFITEVSIRDDIDYRGLLSEEVLEAMRLGSALSVMSVFVGAKFLFETRKSMLLKEPVAGKKSSDTLQNAKRIPCPDYNKAPSNCGRLADGTYRMSHDLVCSMFIPKDGKYPVEIRGPFCNRNVTIELFDCCVKHDIALWCAENDPQAMLADQAVVACVSSGIYTQTISKAPGFFCVLYALTAGAIAALTQQVLGMIGALFAWYCHGRILIGYKGRNRDSCLCGGTAPTRLCSGDRCEDVCKRKIPNDRRGTTYGREQDCSQCSVECHYDADTGVASGWKHINKTPTKPCCISTEEDRLTRDRNLRKDCPDRCSFCEWQCIEDRNKDGTRWRRWYHFHEFKAYPCCGGKKPKPDDKLCRGPEINRGTNNARVIPDTQSRLTL